MTPQQASHFIYSVNLALLTGSDYTEGVETVGAVTAMEVLAEFPGDGLGPLEDFKVWSSRVAPEIGMPVGNKTREKLRKLKLPPSFPSQAVVTAYLKPSVDESSESFTWAVPNLVAVRDFARERFGWDRSKIDRLLSPVVRALDSKRDSKGDSKGALQQTEPLIHSWGWEEGVIHSIDLWRRSFTWRRSSLIS